MGSSLRTWILIGLGMLVGCGESRPKLFSVSGKVLVDGRPADRAVLTFYTQQEPIGLIPRSFAVTSADGSFRAFTFERDDGVPPGEYAVTIVLPQYGKDEDEGAGPDLLSRRYADPINPKFKVKVVERENELPTFKLTTTEP